MSKQTCAQFVTELNQRLIFNLLDSLEGTKTIVWDRFLMTEINSIVSHRLLKEHHVVSHVCPISNPIAKKTDFIIYILPSSLIATEELVKYHLEKIQAKDEKRHRIFYVPEVSYIYKEKLVSAFPWIEDKITSLQLRWFPTDEENFVSLNLDSLVSTMLVYEDWNELYKCAKALRQIEAQMEEQPRIVFKGEWGMKVNQILEQLRKSSIEVERTLDGPTVDEIILIDRWLDPVTPLFSQKNFAGVVDELFGIDIQGKVKFSTKEFYSMSEIPKEVENKTQLDFYLNDDIYPVLRDSHIGNVSKAVNQILKECQKEEQTLKSMESIAQCRILIKSLPNLLKKKEVLSRYMRMAELCVHELSKFSKSDLMKCEMDIISNKYGDKPVPFIENYIIDSLPLLPILRLIGLQSQLCNGIRTSTWQYYRKLIVQSYGPGILVWLLRLQMSGIIKCSDNADKIGPTYKPIDWESLKRRFKLFVDDPQSDELAKPYDGYVPLLIRIIEEGYSTQFRDWKTVETNNRENNEKKEEKKRLLFVIGGVTRAEMGLIRKRFPEITQCYVSDVITGDSLLQKFRD